jgi:ribonucleoside-diphosphate reductase subunit M2
MESPIKKLNFDASNKENLSQDTITAMANWKTKVAETKKEDDTEKAVATVEENDEPLLQENPHRFVLFPIKYHEVCDASLTRKVVPHVDHPC